MDLNCALIITPHIKKEKTNSSQLSFDLSVIFDLKDKNKVSEKMEKIKNIIQEKENILPKDIQATEYILGNKIGMQFEETEREGEKIYSLPLPEYPGFTFNYVFVEDKLIFSSSLEAISSILQVIKNSDKNLASDSTFSQTISEFPQESSGLFYLNVQNLIDIINLDDYQINNIYLPYIKSIKSVGLTFESSENEITTYGFLLIK